jgi:hypothetical protein
MKQVLAILALSLACFAQVDTSNLYNFRPTNMMITGMGTDSLKATSWFKVTDLTYQAVIIKTPVDSSAWILGYQRGYIDGDGKVRAQRPMMVLDTINTNTATFAALGSFLPSLSDSDAAKTVDSNGVSPNCLVKKFIYPIWSPLGRYVLKGITGNKNTRYNISVTVNQGKYFRSDAGKQPE